MTKDNIWKMIGLVVTIIVLTFPTAIQADSTYVIDCPEGDEECHENLDHLNLKQNENENNKKNDDVLEVTKTKSLFLSVVQTFFALLLVLALIYLLVKLLNRQQKSYGSSSALENIGGIPIGQNKSIQLVKVGQSVFMIGVGDNVEMLKEITDENLKVELLHNNQGNSQQGVNLLSSLTKFRQKDKNTKYTPDTPDFHRLFEKELTNLKQTREEIKSPREKKDDVHE